MICQIGVPQAGALPQIGVADADDKLGAFVGGGRRLLVRCRRLLLSDRGLLLLSLTSHRFVFR
jgi:hypothetical protein